MKIISPVIWPLSFKLHSKWLLNSLDYTKRAVVNVKVDDVEIVLPLTVDFSCRRYDPLGPWDLENEIIIPDNRTTFNVTGLLPFTAYSFRIFSVNSVGRSLASEPSYPMVTHRERE